jgi:hypothetical protein
MCSTCVLVLHALHVASTSMARVKAGHCYGTAVLKTSTPLLFGPFAGAAVGMALGVASALTPRWVLCGWSMPGTTSARDASMSHLATTDDVQLMMHESYSMADGVQLG